MANGKVEALHSGFGESLERRLRSELDALIAGESLVEDEEKAQELEGSVWQLYVLENSRGGGEEILPATLLVVERRS